MNEQTPPHQPERVFWVNTSEKLTRKRRLKRALFAHARRGSQLDALHVPPSTSIPSNEIETLEDERLKEALVAQHDDISGGSEDVTVPIATASGEFKRIVRVPKGR